MKFAPYLSGLLSFSIAVNLLMLVTPLYMLQIYDRVLTSGSIDTLWLVSIACIGLLVALGFAEAARRKILAIASQTLGDVVAPASFDAAFSRPDRASQLSSHLTALRHVQAVLRSGGVTAVFDLLFTPLFLVAMFLVHAWIGWLGILSMVVLVLLTCITEWRSKVELHSAQLEEQAANQLAGQLVRSQAVIDGLGMRDKIKGLWLSRRFAADDQVVASESLSAFMSSQAKGLRLMVQSAALGIGAWLVLQQQLSAGAIIAGSLLLGRALAPIDQILGSWRHLTKAKQAWQELSGFMQHVEERTSLISLPKPQAVLDVEGIKIAWPGATESALPKFSVQLKGGRILAVVGPSGAGKTTLLNTLSGIWPTLHGKVRLGGRDLHSWPSQDRGQHVGYAPQEPNLLPGTVAENIARFAGQNQVQDPLSTDASAASRSQPDPADVVEHAIAYGFHETISRLPQAYDTKIDPQALGLSRGEQQTINLARALYGEPVLICMDEPSANLDPLAYQQLERGLRRAQAQGSILIISTHDPRVISLADDVLLMGRGTLKMVSGEQYNKIVSGSRMVGGASA